MLADPWTLPVLRRSTTGAAAFVDGGLLVSIALPSIDAIHRDATPRTILNRNVRPLLAGFRGAGIAATYLGRDFLSAQRRPLAALGIDGTRSGALLVEALASERAPFALPRAAVTDLEAGTPRLRGLEPVGLAEVARGASIEGIAAAVLEGIAARLGAEIERREVSAIPEAPPRDSRSPLDGPVKLFAPQPIPMGWLDLALVGGLPWIGGDVLAPTYALGHSFELAHPDVPMEGAEWEDVRRGSRLLAAALDIHR
ncbi:MAG TPA: hypothetical protein VL400_14865 [Polyangiaceae bacterium]|nr:hypothetical protein [Polyangiaceae bacterium]